MILKLKVVTILVCLTMFLIARDEYSNKTWGIGVVARVDSIAYKCVDISDDSVENFVPLFYYEDDNFYMNGLTYGLKLFSTDNLQFSLLSRIRLLSIPKEMQNEIQDDSLDFGLRSRYFLEDNQYIDLEFMRNTNDGNFVNLTYSYDLLYDDVQFSPYATLSHKGSTFNSQYYGRDIYHVESDFDISAGFDIKYHIYTNFYILAGASMSYLGNKITSSKMIDDNFSHTLYAGIGFLNDRDKKFFDIDGMKPYMRIAQGWATTSNLNDIMSGATKEDKYNNQLTSIFYGHPISKQLFNQKVDVYLSSGLVYHHASTVQDTTLELDFEFKPYYTLPLSFVDIRLGAGAGLSYIQDVTYIEKLDGEAKGYKMSNVNFFLDISADINLGFIGKSFDDVYIGTAIHHRSSVFESSSLFGRIKGGSNYNTVYLQWHF